MLNKKILITIITVIFLLVFVSVGLALYNAVETQHKVKSIATEFVGKWANYQNQYSTSYINSLKPYLTVDQVNKLTFSAQTVGATDIRYGLTPLASSFTNFSVKSFTNSKGIYTIKVSGVLKYTGTPAEYNRVADIILKKVDNKWQVSNMYFED